MPKLYPEDQARVDQVLSKGIYKTDRKPFRPLFLMFALLLVLVGLTAVSYGIAAYYQFV